MAISIKGQGAGHTLWMAKLRAARLHSAQVLHAVVECDRTGNGVIFCWPGPRHLNMFIGWPGDLQ